MELPIWWFRPVQFFPWLEQEFANYVKANPEQREGLPVPIDEGTIGNIQIGRGGL